MGALDKLVDVVLDALRLLVFWVVINPYERGVLLRLGKFVEELGNDDGVFGTGLHFCWPVIDHVLHDNVKPRTYRLGVQSLTTTDGVTVDVSAVVTASIRNIRKSLLEVESVDDALADSCVGVIGTYVCRLALDELFGTDHGPALVALCHEAALAYGIKLHKIQLADVSRSRVFRVHGEREHPLHSWLG